MQCPLFPIFKNNNVTSNNDFIECEDVSKLVKYECQRFPHNAWCCEDCNNNKVYKDTAAANRHRRRHHLLRATTIITATTDLNMINADNDYSLDGYFDNLSE